MTTPTNGLTDAYLAECEQRARCFSGAYTGTSGTLAADVIRLLYDVRRLKAEAAYRENRRMPSLEPVPSD